MDYRNMETNQLALEGNEISRHDQRLLLEVFLGNYRSRKKLNNYNWFKHPMLHFELNYSYNVTWIELFVQCEFNGFIAIAKR